MIELTTGNLLEANTEALVNTVNCVGVMGKGIALQFKQAYPNNFSAYEQACRAGEIRLGRMFTFPTGTLTNPKYIINFPTKRHWRGKYRLEDIKRGLVALIDEVQRLEITSIAVPPLGCGNGGLHWSDVRPPIEAAFAAVPHVRVLLYAPTGAPDADAMLVRTTKPKMTRARALLMKLIERYGVPGYRLSLLEIQKLAYFLQWAGEPLWLHFSKQKYGPYAENLHFVLQRLEGHFLRGYGDRSTEAQISLLPNVIAEADTFLAHDPDAVSRLERISQLIEGFETPYGMELLASAHWVATHEAPPATDLEDAIARVHAWNGRKQYSSHQRISASPGNASMKGDGCIRPCNAETEGHEKTMSEVVGAIDQIPELQPPTSTPTEWSEVECPLLLQLVRMGWQYLYGDIDVPELTEREHF